MAFRDSVTPLHTAPSAPITTGIVRTFFKFQPFQVSISRSRYLVIFSASFLITFIQTSMAPSMIIYSRRCVLCTIIIGQLCGAFLTIRMYESNRTLIPSFIVTSEGTCFSHDSGTSNFNLSIFSSVCTLLPDYVGIGIVFHIEFYIQI